MNYIKDRLNEPSTWRGLVWIGAVIIWLLSDPEQRNSVLALAAAVAGGLGVAVPEKNK